MAASNSGNAYDKSGKKKTVKPASKKPAAKPASGYDWGDGRNVHTISLADHRANVQGVKDYGVTPSTPLDQPLTAGQAYGMAQATAGRTYNPQIDANRQLQVNTPAWYQNYITTTGQQQAALAAQSAPILNTAQTAVTNAGATAPGLDPNSPQAAKEAQAALGRQVMAQDSANYLGGVAQAGQNYLSGQANTAARELPQVQAGLLSQYGQLQTQKQDAATQAYGDIRTGEQNAAIARQTLGLNTASAAADVDLKRGVDPVTGKPLPADPVKGYAPGGPGLNKYGFTYDQWSGMSAAAQAKARKGNGTTGKTQAEKDAEKKAAADVKNKAAIKKATGGVQNSVRNVINKWNGYVGQQTDDTSKPKDPVTGEYPPRDLKPSDIKRILGEKNDAGLIHVALLVRAGKPLDQAAIDYLHQKDPNIRVPREWLNGKKAAGTKPPNRAPAPKNDPSGYGNRPT